MSASVTMIGAGAAFCRAIEASAQVADRPIKIVSSDWTQWASASFTGARHRLTIQGPDSGAFHRWLRTLQESEDMPMRGHQLADILVLSVSSADGETTAVLEALTVEE